MCCVDARSSGLSIVVAVWLFVLVDRPILLRCWARCDASTYKQTRTYAVAIFIHVSYSHITYFHAYIHAYHALGACLTGPSPVSGMATVSGLGAPPLRPRGLGPPRPLGLQWCRGASLLPGPPRLLRATARAGRCPLYIYKGPTGLIIP